MPVYTVEDKRHYAEWLVTPPAVKRGHGMPTSRTAYAKSRGINPRTLHRWENEDKVTQRLIDEARARWREAPEAEKVAEAESSVNHSDPAAAAYEEIREAIVSEAKSGNKGALDLFMKHWGRPFVEEEIAARQRGLEDVDDETLVENTLELIGRERVAAWLKKPAAYA